MMKSGTTARSVVRRIAAGAAIATLATLGVTACSPEPTTPEPSGSAAETPTDTEFTYWSMWNQNEPQAIVLQDAFRAFTKDTGIKVNVQWQGRQVVTKLTPTIPTGAAADLIDQSVNRLGPLVAAGQTEDLTSVYDLSIPGEDQTVGDVISADYTKWLTDADGGTFMVPYEVLSEAAWFNSTRFPDLEKNPPKTWSDFTDQLDAIKASGVTPIAIPSTDAYWITLLLQRELGYDGLRQLASDKSGAAWDDPKVTDAAEKFADMRAAGYFAEGYEGNQGADAENSWAAGDAALYLDGSWVPSETKPNVGSDFTYGALQLPAIGDGDTAVGVNLIGFAIPKTAEHKSGAAAFIAYFEQKKWQQRIATEATQISPRSGVEAPDEVAAIGEALKNNELYPDLGRLALDYSGWNTTVAGPLFNSLTVGQLDASDFAAQGKQATIDYWKTAP